MCPESIYPTNSWDREKRTDISSFRSGELLEQAFMVNERTHLSKNWRWSGPHTCAHMQGTCKPVLLDTSRQTQQLGSLDVDDIMLLKDFPFSKTQARL